MRQLKLFDNAKYPSLDKACLLGQYSTVQSLIAPPQQLGIAYKIEIPFDSLLLATVCRYADELMPIFKKAKVDLYKNYQDIISLLISTNPQQVNYVNDKGCNALYYVVGHLADLHSKIIKGCNDNYHYSSFMFLRKLAKTLIVSGTHLYNTEMGAKSVVGLAERRKIDFILTELIDEIKKEENLFVNQYFSTV